MWSKYVNFLKEINDKDRVVICFDQDGDGISSAVILSKFFERNHITNFNYVPFRRHSRDQVAENILKYDPTKLIVLDISAEEYPEFTSRFTEIDLMIIDHHRTDIHSDEFLILKPEKIGFEKSYQYPTAKLVYELCSKLVNLEDISWLLAVGLISDSCDKTWFEDIQNIYSHFNFELKSNIHETIPGLIAQIVNSATLVSPKRTNEAINLLMTKTTKEILKSSLAELNRDINYEIKRIIDETNQQEKNNLIIMEIEPKYAVAGIVGNKLSFKNLDKTYVIITKYKDHAEVSARSQSGKVNCSKMLKKAISEFEDSNAGGHIPAAGAAFPIRYLENFKSNLISQF